MSNLRTPLANVGGPVERRGDAIYGIPLASAMQAQDSDVEAYPLIHRFHSYPARMHPGLARSLVTSLRAPTRQMVFDPFCGSGTVVIEAMLAGYRTLGSDLNPLAIRLARCKSQIRRDEALREYLNALEAVSEASLERVRGRVDSRADLSPEERQWYDVHILKELAGLLAEIRKLPAHLRDPMEMVFSAIVVKFSKQRADTREIAVEKHLRKGLVSEFFVRKGQELAMAWDELAQAMPQGGQEPRFVVADASMVSKTLGGSFTCDLIITSPPYGGTYDYADHHARRMAWLGLQAPALARDEIGARRRYDRPADPKVAASRWDQEMRQVLLELARCLNVGGLAVVLLGDAQFGGENFDAGEQLQRLAPQLGLDFLADVAQLRTERHGGGQRREHLIALSRQDVELPARTSDRQQRGAEKPAMSRAGGSRSSDRVGDRPSSNRHDDRDHSRRPDVQSGARERSPSSNRRAEASPSRDPREPGRSAAARESSPVPSHRGEVSRSRETREPPRRPGARTSSDRGEASRSRETREPPRRPGARTSSDRGEASPSRETREPPQRTGAREPSRTSSDRSEGSPAREARQGRQRPREFSSARTQASETPQPREPRERTLHDDNASSGPPRSPRPPASATMTLTPSRAERRARLGSSSHWQQDDAGRENSGAKPEHAWQDDRLAAQAIARESEAVARRQSDQDISATYDRNAMRLVEPGQRIGRKRFNKERRGPSGRDRKGRG